MVMKSLQAISNRYIAYTCYSEPYISLFFALKNENWHLRMASMKSMAASFTAFDRPILYQKLISQHIVDMLNMPSDLLRYFEAGVFVLSVTCNISHSVALDECHEMLINKHVKQALVRPSKDHINRIAKYIPVRMTILENLKAQILPKKLKTLQAFLLCLSQIQFLLNHHQMSSVC